MTENELNSLIDIYKAQRKAFSGFMNNVLDFFQVDNTHLIGSNGRSVVHSIKSREKDTDHLREKLLRKENEGAIVSRDNLFSAITDFCGVRILHVRLLDFAQIHAAISNHVSGRHWVLAEEPKAYTWDPEYKSYFEMQGVKTEIKESFYTSVHYVVKPNDTSFVTCEIQVRSLFEEIWGEVDHDLNYPKKTSIKSCEEQLKVLAKLVGAGTKLVESIYASVELNVDKSELIGKKGSKRTAKRPPNQSVDVG